jgi:hypothetical protein
MLILIPLADRNSMRMAQLEARYMRPWVRMNREKDNCLEDHDESRKSKQSIMEVCNSNIYQTRLIPTDSKNSGY